MKKSLFVIIALLFLSPLSKASELSGRFGIGANWLGAHARCGINENWLAETIR